MDEINIDCRKDNNFSITVQTYYGTVDELFLQHPLRKEDVELLIKNLQGILEAGHLS